MGRRGPIDRRSGRREGREKSSAHLDSPGATTRLRGTASLRRSGKRTNLRLAGFQRRLPMFRESRWFEWFDENPEKELS